ncbi:hypothetical protein ES703_48015 [subsurface metagenome]
MIGLSKDELEQLYSFGKTQEEESRNKYGKDEPDLIDIIIGNEKAARLKTIELILANNEKVTRQLKEAGINFPD